MFYICIIIIIDLIFVDFRFFTFCLEICKVQYDCIEQAELKFEATT